MFCFKKKSDPTEISGIDPTRIVTEVTVGQRYHLGLDKMSKYLTENGVDIARCKGYNDEVILVRGMKPIYDRTFGFRSNQKKACAPVQ